MLSTLMTRMVDCAVHIITITLPCFPIVGKWHKSTTTLLPTCWHVCTQWCTTSETSLYETLCASTGHKSRTVCHRLNELDTPRSEKTRSNKTCAASTAISM